MDIQGRNLGIVTGLPKFPNFSPAAPHREVHSHSSEEPESIHCKRVLRRNRTTSPSTSIVMRRNDLCEVFVLQMFGEEVVGDVNHLIKPNLLP